MTPQRREHLYHQYVLSIINDSAVYRRIKECIDQCNGREFSGINRVEVSKIASSLGETMPDAEGRAYIAYMVWVYHGGTPQRLLDSLGEGHVLRPHLHALRKDLELQSAPQPASQPEPQEDQPVNNTTPAFETKHFVFGMDVANMTPGQLLEAIKKIENEIAELKLVKSKSEFIKKRIAELDGMLTKVVEVLDAK